MDKYFKSFIDYVKRYDIKEKGIMVKHEHSIQVYKNALTFIQENNFSEDDNKLIKFISLFHDIGRFEQIKRYGTMDDNKSIDHGKLGCDVLIEEKLLDDFTEEERNIILKAMFNHNKRTIESDLTGREEFHCRVIRDLDKLDIYRVYFKHYMNDYEGGDINDNFYKSIINNRHIDYSEIKNDIDFVLLKLSWVYDFNFPFISNKIIERGYFDKLLNMIPASDRKSDIKKVILSELIK